MKDLCAGLQSNTTLAELSCDYNVSEGEVGPIMGTALKDTRIEVKSHPSSPFCVCIVNLLPVLCAFDCGSFSACT